MDFKVSIVAKSATRASTLVKAVGGLHLDRYLLGVQTSNAITASYIKGCGSWNTLAITRNAVETLTLLLEKTIVESTTRNFIKKTSENSREETLPRTELTGRQKKTRMGSGAQD